MLSKNKIRTFATAFLLILSAVLISGCMGDQESQVGIPSDAELEWDYDQEENRVEMTVPIRNTYEEPKDIVVQFMVITSEENRYSEIEILRLPEDSKEEYSHSIDIPKNETANSVDARILVWEDEVGIVDVSGEDLGRRAVVNATIANTNPEQENITVRFEAETEQSEYVGIKRVNLPKSSMDEYSQRLDIPNGETVIDYRAEII